MGLVRRLDMAKERSSELQPQVGHLSYQLPGSAAIQEEGEERTQKAEDEKFDEMLFSGHGRAALMNSQQNPHQINRSQQNPHQD